MNHHDTCAIIQAQNAERTILHVLSQLLRSRIGSCIVVANGCTDKTVSLAESFFEKFNGIGKVIVFEEKLGPDVGKAAGTYAALRLPSVPAEWYVYVDSDWQGGFGPNLESFITEAKHIQADVLFISHSRTPAHERFHAREDLRLWDHVLPSRAGLHGIAVSESPVAVNKRVFGYISPYWLSQPGLWAAYCLLHRPPLHLALSKEWVSQWTGNPVRTASHQKKMIETLTGDAVEGVSVYAGYPRNRQWKGKEWMGYQRERRLDLLENYMASFRQLQ